MDDPTAAGPLVRHKLQVYFDAHGCELAHPAIEGMADDLDSLALQVANFPVADARVVITWSGRNNEYAVKVSLILPGETLVASDHDPALHAAYARAVASLEREVAGYKERLDQVADRRRQEVGTRQEVTAATPVDIAAIDAAAASGDYPAFRAAVAPYEDSLRLRVGRWVERYPAMEARIGKGLNVNDLMEAVFLDAFEGHAHRPADERYGEWLETLIDPAVRAVERDPDAVLENVNMARAACA